MKIETVKISSSDDLKKYMPQSAKDMVKPKIWELANRKSFYNWLEKNYEKYDTSNPAMIKKVASEGLPRIEGRYQLQPIQKLVRDFMQGENPQRGLLCYFGLGVGKTLSAIAISEAIKTHKKVVFMCKAALKNNFVKDIKKEGYDYMVRLNYWVFTKVDNEETNRLRHNLGISSKVAAKNGGIFLIDYTKNESNYDSMSDEDKSRLEEQLNSVFHNRFDLQSINYTGIYKQIQNKYGPNYFDDKVVIIDEVHNETNAMTKTTTMKYKFYEDFMNAKNTKFIFLTGTPVINKPFETSRMFNILRGYIRGVEVRLKVGFGITVDYKGIKNALKKNRNTDQVVINEVSKTIRVSKNPDNYLTSIDPKNPGVEYISKTSSYAKKLMDDKQFKDFVEESVKQFGYKAKFDNFKETCLPEDEEDFEKLFYNRELNKITKQDLFKKRIAGLTSFYEYKDPTLFPELKPKEPIMVMVPTSEYQLKMYEKLRAQEIEQDKKSMMKSKDDEPTQSSYRLHTRMACSFVYPEDFSYIYEKKTLDTIQQQMEQFKEKNISGFSSFNMIDDGIEEGKVLDKFIQTKVLKMFKNKEAKEKYFNMDALKTYSPKYRELVKRLNKEEGLSLIYSFFITTIGGTYISFALDATGEWDRFEIKKIDGEWDLVSCNPEHDTNAKQNLKRKRYIMYSGQQTEEEKKLLPIIFNSLYSGLGPEYNKLKNSLIKYFGKDNNLHGEVAKAFIITASGAEGLDLKNVRNVHIIDPYWQPVLIEQVIGRAVRTRSHFALPPEERNVKVYKYLTYIPDNQKALLTQNNVRTDFGKTNHGLNKKGKLITTDEYLYILSAKKKELTDQVLKLIKESAFDCTLNFAKNSLQHKNLICLDYDTSNRDEYLFSPSVGDTQDIMDKKQERVEVSQYMEIKDKKNNKVYYVAKIPNAEGIRYVYDESLMTQSKTKLPKPVGKYVLHLGKWKIALLANKNKASKAKNKASKASKVKKISKITKKSKPLTTRKTKRKISRKSK